MSEQKLTRQQIYAMRGKLKAKQRADYMRKRYERQRHKETAAYQERLARDIGKYI